jgi:hypothetical protein
MAPFSADTTAATATGSPFLAHQKDCAMSDVSRDQQGLRWFLAGVRSDDFTPRRKRRLPQRLHQCRHSTAAAGLVPGNTTGSRKRPGEVRSESLTFLGSPGGVGEATIVTHGWMQEQDTSRNKE